MSPTPVQPLPADALPQPQPANQTTAAEQIRGSSLLLLGRFLAMGLEFGAQVLLVRYLSKGDYGALSYALAIVTLFQGLATFEMRGTLGRFVPLYREHKQYGALFGSIAFAFVFVTGLGTLMALAVMAGLTWFGLQPTGDPRALQLLVVVAFLIPIQSIDSLFPSLFAVFGGSRAIFLRQSVLTPGLRLALVALLVFIRADVTFLALGYLAISAVGVLLYVWMFAKLLHQQGLISESRRSGWSYPVRELLGYSTPMLVSTLVWLLMESSDAVLLGYYWNTEAVASFRTVLTVARLNQIVILSFSILYTPLASRLYARKHNDELAALYWQTSLWMTILTFPVFVMTFSFARSMTVGIYGERYSDAVPVLILLSLGYYFHTSLGFNGVTLKIFGRLKYAVIIDIAAAIVNIAINLILVPRWGLLGAASGTAGTMILHNLLKQYGLWRYTGIELFRRRYLVAYCALFGLPLALLAVQMMLPANLWLALLLGGSASLIMLWSTRHMMQIETIFPEVLRIPGMRAFLGRSS